MKKLLSTVALMGLLSTSAFAADISVDMLNKRDDGAKMVYSEDISTIEVGIQSHGYQHQKVTM